VSLLTGTDPYLLVESPEGDQRWLHQKTTFIPPSDCFKATRAKAEVIPFRMAADFVTTHHYSGAVGTCRLAVGLFYKPSPFEPDFLGGVAIIGNPIQPASIRSYFEGMDPSLGVEMNRLVLLDSIPFNAESFLIGRALRMLRRKSPELRGVLSYCDPMPLYTADGRLSKRGHSGVVYRCTNAAYRGKSKPRIQYLNADGRVVSERSISKLRLGEAGDDGMYRQLLALGAPERRSDEKVEEYIKRALTEGPFRRQRHAGKNVFAWELGGPRTFVHGVVQDGRCRV
jgi:hypothetical protein